MVGVSRCNHEGYPDPTPYGTLSHIEQEVKAARTYRLMIYICSPFSGDVSGNIVNARRYSRFAVEQGYIPIAPHLLFPQFLDDTDITERELGLHFGNVLMRHCSEVWVFGAEISDGMVFEIEKARRQRKTIRYFTEDLKEVTL